MKKGRKILSLALSGMLILSMITGCTPETSEPSTSENPQQSSASGDTEKAHPELNLRITADPPTLDPYATSTGYVAQICMQMFDSLVKFDGDDLMTAVPSLAEDWEISEDGTVYTFYLRDDVTFHNGDPMTADDVVYSVERFINGAYTASKAPFVTGAEKVDEYTVNIMLDYAYPNFILQLCSWPWRIVCKDAVERYGDGSDDLAKYAGTGPYILESLTPGVGVTMVSNPDYFEGEPYFERINYKLIPDNTTATTALLNGEIDLDQISTGLDLEFIEGEEGFEVTTLDRPAAYILILNTTGVMANEDFRKAVAHAIDKESFVELVYDGMADPNCFTFMRSYEEGYSDDLPRYDFDLEKSKEYLAASGLPESEWKLSIEIPATGYGPAFGATLKEMLAQAGITLELVQAESGAWSSHVSNGNFDTDMIMSQFNGIPYNPPLVYNLYLSSTSYANHWGAQRPGGLVFPEIDELGQAASRELDAAKRSDLFNQMHRLINEHCLYIPIAYIQTSFGHSEHLKGMEWEGGTLVTKVCDWYWEE